MSHQDSSLLLLSDELLGSVMTDLQIAKVSQVSKTFYRRMEPLKAERRQTVVSVFNSLKAQAQKGVDGNKITIKETSKEERGRVESTINVRMHYDYIHITINGVFVEWTGRSFAQEEIRAQVYPRCKTIRWSVYQREYPVQKGKELAVIDKILYQRISHKSP